jgi:hypothetical protein
MTMRAMDAKGTRLRAVVMIMRQSRAVIASLFSTSYAAYREGRI